MCACVSNNRFDKTNKFGVRSVFFPSHTRDFVHVNVRAMYHVSSYIAVSFRDQVRHEMYGFVCLSFPDVCAALVIFNSHSMDPEGT